MQQIFINTSSITLGQFLKFANIIKSGNEAKTFLQTNQVLINNRIVITRGTKLYPQDIVVINKTAFLISSL